MADHVVMKTAREKLRIMSVNQLNIYHVALEMFNIMVKSSAESTPWDCSEFSLTFFVRVTGC